MKYRLILVVLVAVAHNLFAQGRQPGDPLPRFRSGANLVNVDAFISKDGVAITDFRPDEIEIYEDDQLQRMEGLRLVPAQGAVAPRLDPLGSTPERDAALDPDARVFILFFDQWHVSLDGSSKAASPVAEFLNRIIGDNDLIALMTPEIAARGLSLTRRTSAIYGMVKDSLNSGDRDTRNTLDPRERELELCYPEGDQLQPQLRGVARALIERRREQRTLRALNDLVSYLGSLRDERKIVILLSEGWILFRPDDSLGGELIKGSVTGAPSGASAPGVDSALGSCERERALLANVDHVIEVRELAQRANRANVTFYAIDPRGLPAFDDPRIPTTSTADGERLSSRRDALRELAQQTDGAVVLNTNDVRGGAARMLADQSWYYVMSYYSSNPKLDGRFRRLTVRTSREGVTIRARPGYVAPTESEARTATTAVAAARTPATPPTLTRAIDAVAPLRGALPVRIQASGALGRVRATVELDQSTVRHPDWLAGATLRVMIEPERGFGTYRPTPVQVLIAEVAPGQRTISVAGLDPLNPGRYAVRAEITPRKGKAPVQATTFVSMPDRSAIAASSGLALRRGPSTGLAYMATADPRFRRTERLRLEVPVANNTLATGRLLTRRGQPLPLVVSYSTRVDEATDLTIGVADVALAPLAAGEYVLEIAVEKEGKTATVAYGFRIIP